ncbi:SET domain-containing protein [Hymenopellis radicata]|nr:SET domain-containing protein [Hymenopellis radicata]
MPTLSFRRQKGVSSRWHGYLQSLPTHIVDIPLFWPAGDPAVSLSKNTEIERKMSSRGTTGMTMLEEFYAFYEEMVVPIYTKHRGVKPSIEEFQRAYSLVSSRAFLVDAYHGLAMVPIADAFNHSQDNHVHLESEFDVCPECGALQQCSHDSPPSSPISAPSNDSDPGYFEMVTNTVVPADEEVFNTYGEELSNADLLIRYGFMSDVNDNDRVSWDFTETERLPVLDFSALEESELVWVHEGPTAEFYINSDGILSHHLFLRLSGIREQVGLNELFASPDALRQTAMSVLELCTRRNLADLADVDIESVSPRTRLVALEIMAEQAILETCIDKWRALLDDDESS